MKRQIILGPYELIEDQWVSRGRIDDGTVRVIEGVLYYSITDILIGEKDICNQTADTKITRWVEYGNNWLNDNYPGPS